MPFIFRCPNSDCGKFLLLEDEEYGETIPCLNCKEPIDVAIEMQIVDPDVVQAPSQAFVARANGQRVIERACPKCDQSITFPEEKKRQAVQCENCDFWGILT